MKPSSLGLKLFLVLAVFAAAPTILMVTLSDFALRTTIGDEIGKAAIGKLRVAHGIEAILSDLVRNTCMRIALDPELQALAGFGTYQQIVADGEAQYLFARYLDVLDDTVRTNPLFHSLYIVFEETDYVLSSESGTVYRPVFNDRLWLEETAQKGFGGVGAFLPPHREGDQGDLVLSYFFPFPSYLTQIRGAVVVNLQEREFSRLINDPAQGGEGTVSLLDDEGILVSHGNQALVGKPWSDQDAFRTILDPSRNEGVWIDESEGGHLVTWYRPEPGIWTYVGDFPLRALTENVGLVRLATAGASVVLVLIGVGVSYLIARRFFHPVRRLIREVNRRIGRQEDWEGNELTLLSEAFDILLKRETQLFQDLESQQRRQNEEWAGRALRGELPAGGVPAGPADLNGRFWAAGFLAIDRYPAFVRSFAPDQREYLRSVVLHMAEQAFLPGIRCLGTVTDPRGIALVLTTDLADGGEFADAVDDGFETLASEASRVLGTSITLCLGTRGSGASHLSESWSEAEALVHQRFLKGPGQWFWEENPAVFCSVPFFPLKTERVLAAALEARDPVSLKAGVEELRQILRSRRELSYDNVQLILHQLVGAVVRHLVENNLDLTRIYGAGVDLHRSLSEFETLDEALGWMEGVFLAAAEGGGIPDPGYVPAMVRFIRANLHRDFGVEDVAEAVGLSYSHARKVFEDAMGESIVEHTNALRIEEARLLLAGSDRTLDSVATAVGYNNLQSFHRHFKKRAGVTPGEYRNRSQASEFADQQI